MDRRRRGAALHEQVRRLQRDQGAPRGRAHLFPAVRRLRAVKAQHGFARNLPWTVVSKSESEGSASVRLSLCTAQPESEWPHPYFLTNTVTIDSSGVFRQELSVANPHCALHFTTALHTYFRVVAAEATISGLSNTTYLDSLDGRAAKQDSNDAVVFSGEVDRIYQSVPREVTLTDSSRSFAIATTDEPADAIVQTAHRQGREDGDYGDDEWKEHVCHEVARTAAPGHARPWQNVGRHAGRYGQQEVDVGVFSRVGAYSNEERSPAGR